MTVPRLAQRAAACLLVCWCLQAPAAAASVPDNADGSAAAAAARPAGGRGASPPPAPRAAPPVPHLHSEAEQQAGLKQLFSALDANRDGQVDAAETAKYATQEAFDWQQEGWSVAAAAEHSLQALDGPDAGSAVSAAELQAHLRTLLQDHRVVEWVMHGLGLPQYAPAFKLNAITALDFPLLISDGGATLAQDLGVTSKLHQQQILRGLKRLILGLGEPPSAAQQLECSAVNASTVRITWRPPAVLGHPAMHKFVLQRQRVAAAPVPAGGSCRAPRITALLPGVTGCISRDGGGGSGSGSGGGNTGGGVSSTSSAGAELEPWEDVAEPDDEDVMWWDSPPARGDHRYRLAAWSAFGKGAYAVTAVACTVLRPTAAAQHPQHARSVGSAAAPLAAADVQALLAAVAAAGGNLTAAGQAAAVAAASMAAASMAAGGNGGSGAAWTWSAVSSALVVALTIALKASQLRLGGKLAALWRHLSAALRRQLRAGPQGAAAAAAGGEQAAPAQQQGPVLAARSSMRRVGSSHASLASLGGDGQAVDALLPLLAGAGDGVLLHTSSSHQLLSALSNGLLNEPSGLEAAAVAAAAGQAAPKVEVLSDAAAEQLAQAIQRGAHCAHPGCHRRFDGLKNLRRRLESHYCGLCQRMYCLQHTRISPHGPRGGCGLESKCVCHACFAELGAAQQAACERANRLPKPSSSSSSHALARGSFAAEHAGPTMAAGASESCVGEQEGSAAAGRTAGRPEGSASVPHATSAADLAPGMPSATAVPGRATGGGEGRSSSAAARHRWKKAGSVLRALVRFKAAGSKPTSPR